MNLPKQLLKFAPTPRFLENGMFRFTQPSALNDPYEAFPGLQVDQYAPEDIEAARARWRQDGHGPMSDQQLIAFYLSPVPYHRMDDKSFPALWPWTDLRLREEPFHTSAEHDQAIAELAIELAVDYANRTVGIFSMSETPDETLWSHYANDHHGVCIHFDVSHPFFRENPPRKIEYTEQPIRVTINGGMVRIGGKRLSKEALFRKELEFFPEEILYRKQPSWTSEKEWRIVKNLRDSRKTISSMDLNVTPVHLFEIPNSAITGLTFGLRASDQMIGDTLKQVRENPLWHHLALRRRRRSAVGINDHVLEIC